MLRKTVLRLRKEYHKAISEVVELERWVAMRCDNRFQELRQGQLHDMRRAEALVSLLSRLIVGKAQVQPRLLVELTEAVERAAVADGMIRAIWEWFPGVTSEWSKKIYTPMVAEYMRGFDA